MRQTIINRAHLRQIMQTLDDLKSAHPTTEITLFGVKISRAWHDNFYFPNSLERGHGPRPFYIGDVQVSHGYAYGVLLNAYIACT